MLLHTREPSLGLWTGVETTEIARTSRLVSRLTGYQVQPNKAIVGRNAFAHEAGIHQDGVLKERTTYEIMDATTVGLRSNSIVLGKHSGRHALQQSARGDGLRARRPGAEHGVQALQGDRRPQEAGDRDGPRGARHRRAARGDRRLRARVVRGRGLLAAPAARARLGDAARRRLRAAARSPATARSTPSSRRSTPRPASAPTLSDFTIGAVTEGQDALGEVSVVVEVDGFTGAGQGVSTDIIDAAARAYVRALSVAVARSQVRRGDRAAGDRRGLANGQRGAATAGRLRPTRPTERLRRAAAAAETSRVRPQRSAPVYAEERVPPGLPPERSLVRSTRAPAIIGALLALVVGGVIGYAIGHNDETASERNAHGSPVTHDCHHHDHRPQGRDADEHRHLEYRHADAVAGKPGKRRTQDGSRNEPAQRRTGKQGTEETARRSRRAPVACPAYARP